MYNVIVCVCATVSHACVAHLHRILLESFKCRPSSRRSALQIHRRSLLGSGPGSGERERAAMLGSGHQ